MPVQLLRCITGDCADCFFTKGDIRDEITVFNIDVQRIPGLHAVDLISDMKLIGRSDGRDQFDLSFHLSTFLACAVKCG